MGFPWVSGSDDWNVIGESLDLYFSGIRKPDQCGLIFGDSIETAELWIFTYKDMKFPNEDNWEKDKNE